MIITIKLTAKIMKIRNLPLILALLFVTPAPFYLSSCSVISGALQKADHNLSKEEIKQIATNITVRITGDKNGGSGVIIKREGNLYTAVTNRHVVDQADDYKIITPDGEIHPFEDGFYSNFYDIAIMQFQSDKNYTVATIGSLPDLKEEDKVYASGFPANSDKLLFTEGNFSFNLDQPLNNGYQIGYTNPIQQGMSGGAILNQKGELVGINARLANPITPDYTYFDKSSIPQDLLEKIISLNWGMPIEKVASLDPNYLPYTPPALLTGIGKKVNDLSKNSTVKINVSVNNTEENGSGVIIARNNKTYYVLTANHVLKKDASFELITPDQENYKLSIVQQFEGVDLALVKFTSKQDYAVATISDYRLSQKEKLYVFTGGWAKNNPYLRFTAGLIYSQIDSEIYYTKDNKYLDQSNGYGLVYTNITEGGMSGGGVWDTEGRLIGIHAASEAERSGLREVVTLGNSLGVPINTFLSFFSGEGDSQKNEIKEIKKEWLNIQSSSPYFLTEEESDTLQGELFTVTPPPKNAGETQWLNYGNQLWRLFKYDQAINAFNKAVSLNPNSYEAYYNGGLVLSDQNKDEQAVFAYIKATEINADFYPAWREMGDSFYDLKEYELALKAYNKAIDLNNKDHVLWWSKGSTLNDLKRYEEAIEAFDTSINLKPHPFAYNNRGNAYYNLKEYEKAISDYKKAIEIDPNYAYAYNGRGNTYYDLKEYEKAISDYKKAIEIDPNYASAYNGRGATYDDLKEYEKAIDDYSKAIEIDPNDADAYYNRGITYKNLKEYEKAIDDYTKAIEIDPNDADAYYSRGITYDDLKEYEKAIDDYSKAIEIDPNYADAYYSRGLSYKQLGNKEKALLDFRKSANLYQKQGNNTWYQNAINQINELEN